MYELGAGGCESKPPSHTSNNRSGVHPHRCPLTWQVGEATAEGPLLLGGAEAGLECLLFSVSLFGVLHL